MKKIGLYWAPLALYMAFILIESINPSPPDVMPDLWQIDKVFHFGGYFLMGILFARAMMYGTASADKPDMSVIIPASVILFSFGALLEVWQGYVPNRSPEVLDAVANGLGGLSGSFAYTRVRRLITGRQGGGHASR